MAGCAQSHAPPVLVLPCWPVAGCGQQGESGEVAPGRLSFASTDAENRMKWGFDEVTWLQCLDPVVVPVP